MRLQRGGHSLLCASLRGTYGCHLPTRGGPPTCAGLLLAWWGVGGAVGGDGRFAAPGGCRLSAAEGRKKSLAGQATLGACGASFWGSRGYSHSSIWVLLILINLAAAISIVVTVFRVIFYDSCAKIRNKIEIQWYEPIQFAFFIENMYSISKRTVLLMDFHYSMLLCVCDMLLHLIIYKY